jgi:hypothetical protein
MLQPMNKHVFVMILLLLGLLVSRPVEARLTLGVVTGSDEATTQLTSEQADSSASLLAEKLQLEVVVKVFSDSATLFDWLDRFAMIELALLSAKDVKNNPGRFLQIGPIDEQGKFRLVCRQGVGGDLPQRITAIVREGGVVPWMSTAEGSSPASERSVSAESGAASADQKFVTRDELQHVPPLSPGQAWIPQEKSTYLDILPVEDSPAPEVDSSSQRPAVEQKSEVFTEVKTPLTELEREVIKELLPSATESAEPVAPFELPAVVELDAVPNIPASPLPGELPRIPVVEPERTVPSRFSAEPVESVEPALVASPTRQQDIAPESAEVVPSDELTGMNSTLINEKTETEMWSDEEFAAIMGKDLVAAVVAQPDIPQELRPPGTPVVRPGRIARRTTVAEDQLLIASLPEPRKNSVPPRPPNLLPEPEPEPGVVYVVPFVSVMVPDEVDARVFDQFIDTLNRESEALNLQFVILKEGLQRVSPQWLSIRKYVTGEIYAYVEDSGCCSTDLRTKARLSYYLPHQDAPAFGFEYPVKSFFDHDRSTIGIERAKLSDDIAVALASELLKALQN